MDVMVDIETLSSFKNAVVTAVAAVPFNKGFVFEDEQAYVSYPMVQPQIDRGRHIEWRTVQWWLDQGKEAQTEAGFGLDDERRVPVLESLDGLRDLIKSTKADCVWCKGPNFDAAIIEGLLEDFGVDNPVTPFWSWRCVRTVLEPLPRTVSLPQPENAHDPLADAIAQAKQVQTAWEYRSDD